MTVNHGASAITPNLLILGGTTEARALGEAVQAAGLRATLSMAGRVAQPATQALPLRIGGFGGIPGLVRYVRAEGITHLIDATHPFAAQMSRHAVAAAAETALPLCALSRPPWQPEPGDLWTRVADMESAVQALAGTPKRIFLALGRMQLAAFAAQPQHHYLLRLVDPPSGGLDLPNTTVVVDRGPFQTASDVALLQRHGIDIVVSKNAGGQGAYAKIEAARQLGLPVIMIDRPEMPERRSFSTPQEVLAWVHEGALRGV